MIRGEVILTKLHDGIGCAVGPGIEQADRFHRAETQRINAAVSHHFDRQTSLEKSFLVEIMDGRRFSVSERVVEPIVFFACEWTIEVIALTVVDAASRRGRDRSHGGCGVVTRGRASSLRSAREAAVPT